jgi:N,N-dimethylformamidase beta subunit-like, C-terminal
VTVEAARMLRAFPNRPTVDAGGRLVLHVATDAPAYSLRIERWSDGPTIVKHAGPFAGERAEAGPPDRPWDWPAVEVTLPPDAAPGAYVARFSTEGGEDGRGAPRDGTPDARWGTALFVVRARPAARVLVNLPLFTYHAYNVAAVDATQGADRGACLYTSHPAVTLRRPGGGTGAHVWDEATVDVYDPESPRQTFAHWDLHALRWFAAERIAVDVCTDLDLHRGEVDLARYALLCTFGHDEYWTREKRARVEAWVDGGGNVAFFGGNTCWYRVRYEEETATVRRDGQWLDDDPEDSLTGLSYRIGGGVWSGRRPATGYRIERADHPLLFDAQLRNGDVAGASSSLVGYEFDGIDPAHAPAGLEVLGRANLSGWREGDGCGKLWPGHNAAMVTFRRGRGVVFDAGTTDWARALAWDDPDVTAITRSVVRRLSA